MHMYAVEEFQEAFRVYDVDGSGSIEADELRKLMISVGQTPSDEELHHMIQVADADGSGEVDFYEVRTTAWVGESTVLPCHDWLRRVHVRTCVVHACVRAAY